MGKWTERPEEALKPDALSEYKKGFGFIYGELVELNTIIYLAEKIVGFPWDLLGRKDEIFFGVTMRSFHDSSILVVTRLLTDQGTDPFTLPRFKNRVRDWLLPRFQAQFDDHMRNARFDKTIETILEKAKELRNHRIAHTAGEFVAGSLKLYRPSLAELNKVKEALQTLFDVLSFDVECGMLPLEYAPYVIHGGSSPHTTDIDDLLDSVARKSHCLNMAETNPVRWHHARGRLKPEELAVLNEYRRRFGMSEV